MNDQERRPMADRIGAMIWLSSSTSLYFIKCKYSDAQRQSLFPQENKTHQQQGNWRKVSIEKETDSRFFNFLIKQCKFQQVKYDNSISYLYLGLDYRIGSRGKLWAFIQLLQVRVPLDDLGTLLNQNIGIKMLCIQLRGTCPETE